MREAMALSFRYLKMTYGAQVVFRPIIPVIFIDKSDPDNLLSEGLWVDSGADFTLISRTLADALNLSLSPNTYDTGGVGGDVKVRKAVCDIILARGGEAYQFDIPVHVAENFDPKYPLLGRAIVFNKFDVVFRQRNNRVEFQKKDKTMVRIPLPDQLKPS